MSDDDAYIAAQLLVKRSMNDHKTITLSKNDSNIGKSLNNSGNISGNIHNNNFRNNYWTNNSTNCSNDQLIINCTNIHSNNDEMYINVSNHNRDHVIDSKNQN